MVKENNLVKPELMAIMNKTMMMTSYRTSDLIGENN